MHYIPPQKNSVKCKNVFPKMSNDTFKEWINAWILIKMIGGTENNDCARLDL